MERDSTRGYVFVTVGTTSFDALVRIADSRACREALLSRGYSSVVFQIGRGSYIPQKSTGDEDSLKTNYFTFAPSLADFIKNAALIISHAGSGSIFEALRAGRPLVVVANDALMDNHQMELAEELAER
ncbi:hypothetical protein O6H91_18G085300 [Diphasiastrum complanatum]|uniref:Uncharacterized protein n=1 Tax=Diphasiastrum complanatum TaxID=34168 RepID=A0ACC2B3F2_DIPCM|nr:hypothetical protein O6H91_18G085300 [Diphasiastrum complanatum]